MSCVRGAALTPSVPLGSCQTVTRRRSAPSSRTGRGDDGRGGDLHQGGVSLQAAQQLRAGPGRQVHPQVPGRRLRADRGKFAPDGL